MGDCWIGLSLANDSGLILTGRVGKHTDAFIEELGVGVEGKTDSKTWYTYGWEGYERVLPPEVIHVIGKENTQRLERKMGLFDSKRDVGIVVKTSLVSSGSKLK